MEIISFGDLSDWATYLCVVSVAVTYMFNHSDFVRDFISGCSRRCC